MSASAYLLLVVSSVACAGVSALSIAVAARERRRGSAAWPLPGVFGVLLAVGCVARLLVVAA